MVVEFAERLESSGADELWVIEDCFYTAGITLAATALAHTERLSVGIGILPAVARNAAITAMELATLAELAPGRLVAGIGHGVQDWMSQIGARSPSPLTTLSEVITAVRRLLRGETVTATGLTVNLDAVALDRPPTAPPPVLAGVRRPKSLAAAGRQADGIILTELTGPSAVAAAIAAAAPARQPFDTVVYSALSIDRDRMAARRAIAPFLAANLAHGEHVGLVATPFHDELVARFEREGVDGIATAPDDWWVELGAIGTPDDVAAHVDALGQAGATSVSFFPPPNEELAREQVDHLLRDVVVCRLTT